MISFLAAVCLRFSVNIGNKGNVEGWYVTITKFYETFFIHSVSTQYQSDPVENKQKE